MFVRRQRGELNVPTYKEVRLEEVDWMEVKVSVKLPTGGQPHDLHCTKSCSPLPLLFQMVIPYESEKFNLPSLVPARCTLGTPRTSSLFSPHSPFVPLPFHTFTMDPIHQLRHPRSSIFRLPCICPQTHSQWSALKDHRPSPNLHRDDLTIATMSSPLITTDVEVI
jgi:hypothetical protein